MHRGSIRTHVLLIAGAAVLSLAAALGQAKLSDYRHEKPGAKYRISLGDLPAPFATKHVENPPKLVALS
jgi:hypothetical protein